MKVEYISHWFFVVFLMREWYFLEKQCKCGETMHIRLRTVIFQNRVEIENVPIYSCEACNRTLVYPGVKHDLTRFIAQLGREPAKQHVLFNDMNELANLMYKVADKDHIDLSVEHIIHERINELLDLLLLAQTLGDHNWTEDIRSRLSQIAKHTMSVYDFS